MPVHGNLPHKHLAHFPHKNEHSDEAEQNSIILDSKNIFQSVSNEDLLDFDRDPVNLSQECVEFLINFIYPQHSNIEYTEQEEEQKEYIFNVLENALHEVYSAAYEMNEERAESDTRVEALESDNEGLKEDLISHQEEIENKYREVERLEHKVEFLEERIERLRDMLNEQDEKAEFGNDE